MISHYNVIANTLQFAAFEQGYRDKPPSPGSEITLGLLPQSHIYSLVVICHGVGIEGFNWPSLVHHAVCRILVVP
ncbi:hypothetical protein BJX63DRAFT_402418 [Aspergillus granulosus]|uniref:Uncharacterized protein n=1 Tax=Aspergillus granulosus TaxID=176169 RepID=A0ABR4H4M6_9EURO